jgi:hypothetical protein
VRKPRVMNPAGALAMSALLAGAILRAQTATQLSEE